MRDKLLTDKTVVMTSATLMLGGDFSAIADLGRAATRASGSTPAARGGRGRARRRRGRACRGSASTSARRSTTGQQAILYVARHLPPPGRDGLVEAPARRDRVAGRRRRGPHARAVQLTAGGRDRGRGGARAAAPPDHAGPGRGAAARARAAVRQRPPHLPVRHAQPVAGARRPGRHLPAGADRPHPVPTARRPADERPPARRRPRGPQRLHAGRRHPRRAPARPGRRPADPHHQRPRGRGGARPAAWPRPATAGSSGPACRRCGRRTTATLVRQALARLAQPTQRRTAGQPGEAASSRSGASAGRLGELVERLAWSAAPRGTEPGIDSSGVRCRRSRSWNSIRRALDQLPQSANHGSTSHIATITTAQPTATSRIQWLPVPITTTAVISGVHPGQTAGPVVARRTTDHQRYPQRPAGVQAREGGQLVGQLDPCPSARRRRCSTSRRRRGGSGRR